MVKRGKLWMAFTVLFAFSAVEAQQADSAKAVKTVINADAKTIVSSYLDALGGVDELKKINSLHITSGMEMQGMQLNIETKKLAPNFELTTVAMNGSVVSKNFFDGNTGYQEQMGNKTEVSEEDLKDKKAQTTLFEQVDYLSDGYKLEVQGTEKVGDKDAYKLLVTLPSGKTQTEYYDTQSHLLVRMDRTASMQNMDVSTTIDLSDYRKTGNISIPYKQNVAISAGGQKQAFEMNISDIKINEGVTAADFKQ